MSWCSMYGCTGKAPEGGPRKRFSFPKEKEMRSKWIHLCGRKDKITMNGRICVLHIISQQYDRDLKSEILGIPSPKTKTLEVGCCSRS